jgi:L-aminopeptidase/D-esterase-like protein
MRGGVGSASITLPGGVVVGALAVVNAFGDVRDPSTGTVLAGPRLDDGTLGDSVEHLIEAAPFLQWGENTTLAIVATNASLTKPAVTKVAQMAHDGLARAVYPVHTSVDGDVVFAASIAGPATPVGGLPDRSVAAAPDIVGAWGANVVAEAIVRAVLSAKGTPDLPAASDLR